MAASVTVPNPVKMPKLPSEGVNGFIPYLTAHPKTPVNELLEPYKAYEAELRKVYAQQPSHEIAKDGQVNLVPIFAGHEQELKVRARSLDKESDEEKSHYIMALQPEDRKPTGAPAIVPSFKEFHDNFALFSESSLADLDWSNVVAAGSSVTTAMLPVPEKWAVNKKSRREYYHEHLAPASDVDLFLYGLNEEQAIEKIKQIERCVKDSILHEVTTIRTKNAITIASQYPTRHVQIVLRLYNSISQIITGFDVDCACAAYDGKQVYAAPRAITAFMTQCNTIDLTRRSPSYENRLSKYSRRGFEVHWPLLDRTRLDPTIFERSFGRTQGLARLLILEKLPKTTDRDAYMDQRRAERGRPAINRWGNRRMVGNIKENEEEDVAEWAEQEEASSYHTMTVPYGPKYHAARINRLLYAKDLLLNAEWNLPKDREVYLHRHPCFFGTVEEIIQDCCGYCLTPKTDEEIEVAEEESRMYVSGELKFITDDPGRQEIGSFNPITDDEWTTMAYVGDTARLCQAIVDGDLEHVQDWCKQEGVDVNRRDYTGRTPLHLATMISAPEIVKCLIDNGARLTARVADGRTALHMAATRGSVAIVAALMDKSLENEEEEDEKAEARKKAIRAGRAGKGHDEQDKDEMDIDDDSSSESSEISLGSKDSEDAMTMGSFVKVDTEKTKEEGAIEDSQDGPDVYDVDVLAWDYPLSPLHLAILSGHLDVIELLVSKYGADVLLPVKILDSYDKSPSQAIMTLVLATNHPAEKAKQVLNLLLRLGATSAQGDMHHISAFHYIVAQGNSDILNVLLSNDRPAALSVIDNIGFTKWRNQMSSPLLTATDKGNRDMALTLLRLGAKPTIEFDNWSKAYLRPQSSSNQFSAEVSIAQYRNSVLQPVIQAAQNFMGETVEELIGCGADMASLEVGSYSLATNTGYQHYYQQGYSLLDIVRMKLEALRKYIKPDQSKSNKPEVLPDEEFYTTGIRKGSYQYWRAQQDFKARKAQNKLVWESREKSQQLTETKGVKEKNAVVADALKGLERAEKFLIGAGAKTFYELYPQLTRNPDHPGYNDPQTPPYETSLGFSIPGLTEGKTEMYLKLFEAAWAGNLDTIKTLTLATPSKNEDLSTDSPLKIAVQDTNGFSPFSISVLRGHYDLARAIVEISMAQYHKDDNKTQRQRWSLNEPQNDGYSDAESEDGDNLPIFSELVDDTFTIDNLGEVSKAVKSEVLPLAMIWWDCESQRFLDQSLNKVTENQNWRKSLLEYAVITNDMKLLKFIIELRAEQKTHLVEESDNPTSYTISPSVLTAALKHGRTEMLAEMIKATGIGMPLNELVKKSGVEIKYKPKYYQGLSVSGKKRADWAQVPHDRHYKPAENNIPPLLEAAREGSVESVEWFMSDAPLRRYKEFAESNRNDKRIKALDNTGKGLGGALRSWLFNKSELVLHSAIIGNDANKRLALAKHIVSVAPETLEQKAANGWTPLQHAVELGHRDLIAYFISTGADQRQRDKLGRNMLHSMILDKSLQPRTDAQKLQLMMELFNKDAVKAMLLERCTTKSGAFTPLALWMSKNMNYKSPDFIKVLTSYSSGEELEMIDGAGDLPLHVAVKNGFSTIATLLTSLNPAILYRENPTGRTPLEVAHEIYLASCADGPPDVWPFSYAMNHQQTILEKAAEYFAPKEKDEPEKSKKRTWEVCEAADKQIREEARGQTPKRRLVSLFEANEVARRITGPKSRFGGSQFVVNGGAVSTEVELDNIDQWLLSTGSNGAEL